MDLIYNLSAEELYNQAIIFKENGDYDNYIIYITMAANYDYQAAMDNIYKCETYKKQNYARTLKFYEATTQYSYSTHFLAYMYYHGLGVDQDYDKSLELYMMAIEKGNFQSLINIGCLTYACPINWTRIIRIYESAIENNDITTYHKLAYIYKKGLGVIRDYDAAIKLYKIGIEKDDIISLSSLALMYIAGDSPIRNYKEAIIMYKIAIEKGYIELLDNVNILEVSDYGHDYISAFELYKAASKKGHIISLDRLARMHERGLGVIRNYMKAIELYEQAIKKGHWESLNNLAYMYEAGLGVKQNYATAIELYNTAIGRGCISQLYRLISIYQKGIYVPQNYNKILELYKFGIAEKNTIVMYQFLELIKIRIDTEKSVT